MTGIDLFEQAMMLSGMELEDAEALKPFALGCINQLLRDRAYEQQRLTAHAEQWSALRPAAALNGLEDEIPYEECFVQECFPYGLAAMLMEEDDHSKCNWLMEEYERRAAYYASCVQMPILETDA